MQVSGNPAAWRGIGALVRVFSLARALLALVGLIAVTTAATPSSRDWIVRHVVALSQIAGEPAGAVSAAGEIQAEARASQRERRGVTEFIAKRYRVADQAVAGYVTAAYRAGAEHRVDPVLILAVAAIESRFNPVAESVFGAKGLMQVIPKYHVEKLAEHGGVDALLDPEVNIQVGAQILREYLRLHGNLETALQMYAGAYDEPTAQYAGKVLAERTRIEQVLVKARKA